MATMIATEKWHVWLRTDNIVDVSSPHFRTVTEFKANGDVRLYCRCGRRFVATSYAAARDLFGRHALITEAIQRSDR